MTQILRIDMKHLTAKVEPVPGRIQTHGRERLYLCVFYPRKWTLFVIHWE